MTIPITRGLLCNIHELKTKNTDAYQNVLPQLNDIYNKTTGKDFPFTVQQMKTKLKWCVYGCQLVEKFNTVRLSVLAIFNTHILIQFNLYIDSIQELKDLIQFKVSYRYSI